MNAAAREMAGENRLVTALFADISGFTALSRQLATEAVVKKVNECFRMVTDAVYRYEGSINRFIGDCVLAFFGAPLSHENDPERAVRAALEMREAVSGLGLSISVGINTGMTYFGPIGTERHLEVSAYGPDVNLAKRLEDAAKPRQILVGAGTHRLTRKTFDYARLEPISVKGVEGPVSVYEAMGVAERPEKLRGIEGLRARMIGREREFAELKEAADQWFLGHGQMVSVIGEAGIGKSRLVAELREYLATRQFRCLEGRCISIGQPISYWPFLDMLRSYFGLSHQDSEAELARKVTEAVTGLFPQKANGILPFLGRLLSLRFGNELDTKLDHFTPEQVRHQTMMRLRDLFETLARKEPLLLVLEDLHWADDLSLDLISLLMDSLATSQLMLLCVYRPEREHRCWQLSSLAQRKAPESYTEIPLKQLTRQESRELVEELLTIENLPEGVKGMILRKSEGNPFFIEEVIRSLIDRDLVYREGEGWKARAGISDIDVPDTIQGVVLARVDRLQAEAKTVLQCASVIGRLFKYRLLEQLSRQEMNLDRYLNEFENKDLVYEERTVPEVEYTFKHAFTQEATYRGILEKRRREFHLEVAREMERLYGDRLEECYEELAHHYSKSDDAEKAVEYLQKAGDKAVRASAYEDAITSFRKGIGLTGALGDKTVCARREADLQRALGWALISSRGHAAPEAGQACSRARELFEQVGDSRQLFWALFGLDVYHLNRAEYDKEREAGERCIELAQQEGDAGMIACAHLQMGLGLCCRGEMVEALAHCDRALSLYDPHRDSPQRYVMQWEPGVAARDVKSLALWPLGYADRALDASRKAVERARELSHPFTLAGALLWDGLMHHLSGLVEPARRQLTEAAQLSAEMHFSTWLAISIILLGSCEARTGQAEGGIARLSKGLSDFAAQGMRCWWSYYQALLAEAYGKSGQVEKGLELLADALGFVEERGEGIFEAELLRIRSELLLMQGDAEDLAEASFRKAIDVARRQQAKSWELRATTSLSRLLQKQGRTDEARRMLGDIYNWFTEGFDTADLKDAKALLDSLV
jgi:class 3 adenylate cyclase/predicted ATPase